MMKKIIAWMFVLLLLTNFISAGTGDTFTGTEWKISDLEKNIPQKEKFDFSKAKAVQFDDRGKDIYYLFVHFKDTTTKHSKEIRSILK